MNFGVHNPAGQVLSSSFILTSSIGIILICQMGCSIAPDDGHRKTVQSASKILPQAVEMESLFGSADHFISHFDESFGLGRRKWNTEVHFGGRYSLTMQADIDIDFSKNRITRIIGEPQFFLVEHARIIPLPNKRFESHTGEGLIFGPKEWKRFCDSGGDFASLGLNQNKKTVKFFDQYTNAIRHPRESISLIKESNTSGEKGESEN